MSSTIGGITVSIMRGLPRKLRTRVETWDVPGLDGSGAQTLGQGGVEFQLLTVLYVNSGSSNADADAHIAACIALQGTLITVVDSFGGTFNNLLVLDVDETVAKRKIIYQGNANARRVEIRWKLLTAA